MSDFAIRKNHPLGDLNRRANLNFSRMDSQYYQPDFVREMETGYCWPGDWIGRAMLADTSLQRVTGRDSGYLEALFETAYSLRNARGYLGCVEVPGVFDEQQFAGHSWLLRALIQYYSQYGDSRALEMVQDIVYQLYLPAAGYIAQYPQSKEDRVYTGEKSGTLTGSVIDGWRISSDTGCAFISIDGLTDAYALLGDPQIATLIERMTDVFMQINFTGIQMQTHASLTACRGIMRYYKSSGEIRYLRFVEELFRTYADYGMTENYANYNWFCRPTWTEPCAIIDSYILAMDLFKTTAQTEYLQKAHRIYYNALCFAQRFNGGFGCDLCVGPDKTVLTADTDSDPLCEAYWCCTMRGGEGLASVIENAVLEREDALCLTQYFDLRYDNGQVRFKETTRFPQEGEVHLTLEVSDKPVRLDLYIPPYAEHPNVVTDGCAHKAEAARGGFYSLILPVGKHRVALTFGISLRCEPPVGKLVSQEKKIYWHGDLIVGLPVREAPPVEAVDFRREKEWYVDALTGRPAGHLMDNINSNIQKDTSFVQSLQIVF